MSEGYTSAFQNSDMVNWMSAYFQMREEPQFALANIITMLKHLPGVVGIWPGSLSGGGSGNLNQLVDASGNALHLTRNGTTLFSNVNALPYVDYNGSTGYYSHTDAAIFDIIGTEAHVASTLRGLTLISWFFNDVDDADEQIIGKSLDSLASASSSYRLLKSSGNAVVFGVANGGTATQVTGATVSAGNNYFAVGRYDPSTELKIWVGDSTGLQTATNTTSIPASINNSGTAFTIGASGTPGNYFNGGIWLSALLQTALPDGYVMPLFEYSRAIAGI